MLKTELSDSCLVSLYIKGNEEALSVLIDRHKSRIFTTIYFIVKDKYIAEDLLQDVFIKTIKTINIDVVPKSDREYLEGDNTKLIANRFEYFLYRKAEQLFHSNNLTVKESVNNRSLTSDLIQPKEWEKKAEIIENTGLDKLSTSINQTLTDKSQQLEAKLMEVSEHIFNGDNKYVEFIPGKAELKWSIPNKRWQETIDNPLYSQIQHMGIVELMLFVDQKTNFLKSFTHISVNKEKTPVNKEDLIACILANGTNYGLYKMANISDRSMGKLRSVDDSYIRYETLTQSNDKVSNATQKSVTLRPYTRAFGAESSNTGLPEIIVCGFSWL